MDKSSTSSDNSQPHDTDGVTTNSAFDANIVDATKTIDETIESKTVDANLNNDNPTSGLQQWQALSAWSIVSNIFSTLKNILSNGFAIVPIAYTGWQQGFDMQWGILASSVLLILVTLFAIIEWRKFRFRLHNHQLEVKRGLFFTKKDEIPLSRIQNIRYEQPFYFKPLSLGTLVIETAGSKKDEAHLAALDTLQAQTLKRLLLNLSHAAVTPTDTISQANNQHNIDNTQPIVRKSLADLVLFGFYQNNFIWFAVIAGPIAGQIDWDKIFDSPLAQQFWLWVQQQTHQNIGLQTIMVIVGLFAIYSLFSLISIVAAILKYHPYQLDKHDETIQRSGGVISHQQDALAIKRIQLIHVQQPAIARLFSRWTVYFKQVKGHEVEQKTKQHMLVPSVKSTEIELLLASIPLISGGASALPSSYNPIHINWLTKRIVIPLFPAIILTIVGYYGHHSLEFFELTWFTTTMMMFAIYIRYKQWGYVLADKVIWQHSGFLGQQWKRVAFDKVQHVKITQTQSQKHAQLAYVEIGLASGSVVFPYIPASVAQQIVALSLNATVHNNHNWI
ncbi:PH domain-containing protein [Shewanella sp. SG41-4]|uniref:PH domain-containing protein n=1 Tax=Shewanella sp. SG41-4 TaxID=2760976 RepID=UPI0016008BB3|nr:PH domain-containing protein [Shewanella sp. SG41-4]MBB1438999.1 PH domain-containing protein [Shewanella sp. SG41-4]